MCAVLLDARAVVDEHEVKPLVVELRALILNGPTGSGLERCAVPSTVLSHCGLERPVRLQDVPLAFARMLADAAAGRHETTDEEQHHEGRDHDQHHCESAHASRSVGATNHGCPIEHQHAKGRPAGRPFGAQDRRRPTLPGP